MIYKVFLEYDGIIKIVFLSDMKTGLLVHKYCLISYNTDTTYYYYVGKSNILCLSTSARCHENNTQRVIMSWIDVVELKFSQWTPPNGRVGSFSWNSNIIYCGSIIYKMRFPFVTRGTASSNNCIVSDQKHHCTSFVRGREGVFGRERKHYYYYYCRCRIRQINILL